jgi:hypothetical protein
MIQSKPKLCSSCNELKILWRSSPALCKQCNQISVSKQQKSKTNTNDSSATKSRSYRIKSVSDKKLQELKEYRVIRDRYLKENPVCEFVGCESRDVELHHCKGRIGSLLTDNRYFKSLCRKHHVFCEMNPREAKELGLSFDRLSKE